jgi:hypothetical protein
MHENGATQIAALASQMLANDGGTWVSMPPPDISTSAAQAVPSRASKPSA